MKELVERIEKDAVLLPGGVVIVSGFLNHRMDIGLIDSIGREFYRLFADSRPDLILTVEASGIGIACMAARYFGVDMLFAKKTQSKNISYDTYSSMVRSFTRGTVFEVRVDKKLLPRGSRVLIIDDFLADGEALSGLIDICGKAGATVVGAGVCIEKAFQPGGRKIRSMGINLHSLAVADLESDGTLCIREERDTVARD
ncbi:MAG: xanthine phosphoribosyltransferase [Clostridia bacterium]|nr:xanthine phosphoribosyltransferase [Clostridia bacterium]MBP5173804.1 xanthine phosphoribosyltransferase [Clostridia bacterium]